VFALIALLLITPFLWKVHPFYQIALIGQVVMYSLAIFGWFFRRNGLGRSKLFSLPFYFCMVNAACLLAVGNILRGRQIDRWEPQRVETSVSSKDKPQPTAVSSSPEKSSS
jgi:hypothetical protein